MATVEFLERKISGFLRKWLGLPHSLTSAALYGTSNILQLPFSGLTEEFKVVRTREALQYWDSRDCKVSSAGIEVRTGRKWKAEKAVEMAESRLRQKNTGGECGDRQSGLGLLPKNPGQPGPRQGNTPSTPGRGPSRHGGRASEQGDGTLAAGSMDQVGEYTAVQDYLGKYLAGRFPSGPFPGTSCLRCPAKPSEPPCMGEERDTYLPSFFWKRLFRSSPQQLPKGSG